MTFLETSKIHDRAQAGFGKGRAEVYEAYVQYPLCRCDKCFLQGDALEHVRLTLQKRWNTFVIPSTGMTS